MNFQNIRVTNDYFFQYFNIFIGAYFSHSVLLKVPTNGLKNGKWDEFAYI